MNPGGHFGGIPNAIKRGGAETRRGGERWRLARDVKFSKGGADVGKRFESDLIEIARLGRRLLFVTFA